jgi:hypothetical protein
METRDLGPSVNNPILLDPEKVGLIPVGDRYTVFLYRLFTNNFLINLPCLGLHKTVFVNFQTTKDFSFMLKADGHRNFLEYDVKFGRGCEK